MAKCKCMSRSRIVSNTVQRLYAGCTDICANPVCGDPSVLSLFAPLIYDEIGINLCATFDLGVDIATEYPTVTSASIKVIDATYTLGEEGVQVETLTGRPNCYVVTLSEITVLFAMDLFDPAGRLVDTIFPTAVYLPANTEAPTFDEDTNPSSVELELFAPYGFSYDTTGAEPTPVVNFIGFSQDTNFVRQGINLYGIAKLLDFSTDDSTATVGLTLILQSLYFAGYRVESAGKIDVPKGSILAPENSDCMRFVAGDLLNLAIKPLDLGELPTQDGCGCNCGCGNMAQNNDCTRIVTDDTVAFPTVPVVPPAE
ncbi:MAG: hypothetical protein IJ427_07855 [Lachnospiraceae bacterium]|nr:hypothetical protein [Lachnospiraceae bacterium]MBQ8548401.1 hypothetical protein [Lachnospiraceae bacterium]MBQ8847089.1 hypothetical protein [Lachnospiraceae bacterium]